LSSGERLAASEKTNTRRIEACKIHTICKILQYVKNIVKYINMRIAWTVISCVPFKENETFVLTWRIQKQLH